jgi:hypothetical protein
MPTRPLSSSGTAVQERRAAAKRRKALAVILGTKPPKPVPGPSFGEWARRVAGIVKSGRKDLSSIEGFGD